MSAGPAAYPLLLAAALAASVVPACGGGGAADTPRVAKLDVPGSALGVAYDATAGRVWVLTDADSLHTLRAYDAATGERVAEHALEGVWTGVAVPDGVPWLYGAGRLQPLDPATLAPAAAPVVVADADAARIGYLAPSSTPGELWLGLERATVLRRVATADGSVTARLRAPGSASAGLAWDGAALWIADAAQRFYVVDVEHDVTARSLSTPEQGITGLAFDDAGGLWYAVRVALAGGGGNVARLDAAALRPGGAAADGATP